MAPALKIHGATFWRTLSGFKSPTTGREGVSKWRATATRLANPNKKRISPCRVGWIDRGAITLATRRNATGRVYGLRRTARTYKTQPFARLFHRGVDQGYDYINQAAVHEHRVAASLRSGSKFNTSIIVAFNGPVLLSFLNLTNSIATSSGWQLGLFLEQCFNWV